MIRRVALAAALALAASTAAGCAMKESGELGVETYIHNAQGYVDGGHYAEALGQFRNALALDPENKKALLGEATCLYWTGMAETSEGGRAVAVDAALPGDVLTIEFSDDARYVINSHVAARQIWLAAERNAWHFDVQPDGRWLGVHSHMSLARGVPQDSHGRRAVKAR